MWVIAALGLLLAFANGLALYFHFFYYYWWFDIPMHVVGGLWLAFIALAYYYSSRLAEPKPHGDPSALIIGVIFAFMIGLAWELFEFSMDTFMAFSPHNMSDTLNDLLNDMIGAVFASEIFVTEKFNWPQAKNND
jgi:uncharacterized membrane protein